MRSQGQEGFTVPPDRRPGAAQPRWRQDFPIEWPHDEYVSRRDFTKFMVLTSLAFTVGQFWILLQRAFRRWQGALPPQKIAAVDEVPVGGSLVFAYPQAQSPCILVRVDERAFVAYDQQCTHLACPVVAQPTHQRLYCPCHEGFFDLMTGQPIAGPPRRPLARIALEIRDAAIFATGRQGGLL